MADLSAVLRKTIDGLPNATPELRAKVYDKARAAIERQIVNAAPQLADDAAAMRRAALEDAIGATEAHYSQPDPDDAPPPSEPGIEPPPALHPPFVADRRVPPPEPPRMPRAEANFAPVRPERDPHDASQPGFDRPADAASSRREPAPVSYASAPPIEPEGGVVIPDADTSAPRYAAPRSRRSNSRKPLLLGTAAVILIAALGAGAYFYGGLSGLGGTQSADTSTPADGNAASPSASGATSQTSAPSDTASSAPSTATPPTAEPRRQFTQRLQADGTEVDDGPAPANPNAFDEGTNIAAATPEETPTPTPTPPVAPEPSTATPPPASSVPQPQASQQPPAPSTNGAVPAVAQRAMFYEERTATLQGTQQTGNVVWSLVNEPPADGQPAEPAIRAEATVPSENIRMTMTIRRNLDATLPASHVIELQFDVPPGFAGGQVASVQRLALKPSEEARGEPLIGVAGKISDGFFIIALNNLNQATETNLGLLSRQEWIDIPIGYATGRRALMSIEKGVPGERVFKEALDAWAAART